MHALDSNAMEAVMEVKNPAKIPEINYENSILLVEETGGMAKIIWVIMIPFTTWTRSSARDNFHNQIETAGENGCFFIQKIFSRTSYILIR